MFGITATNSMGSAVKIMQGRSSVSTVYFSVHGINLYIIFDCVDYLELKVGDIPISSSFHQQIASI